VNADAPKPDVALLRKYRIRITILLIGGLLFVAVLSAAYRAINTLHVLNAVELERDQWQRASDVIASLELRKGSSVADLGSGAGYFSLKLARAVGVSGRILAEDIRRTPLIFLRIRALSYGLHNVDVIMGDSDDPHLPVGTLDAVLIANSYHEFSAPESMLGHTLRSLRPGGRLVVLDRRPDDSGQDAERQHEVSSAVVEAQVRKSGFNILHRKDDFIDHSGERWWLLIATPVSTEQ
jgi:ubiquinone/menaquinone biosynthesis C-methylase UbiE